MLVALLASACAGQPVIAPTASPLPTASPAPTPNPYAVSTSAELIAALAVPSARDVIVNPGEYDSARPFVNNSGHRIIAARPGQALFTAGLVFGGSAAARNGVVEGIAFDIGDPRKTLAGAAINIWGDAVGVRVSDVTIDGHGVIGSGVMARQPEGLVIQRVSARGFSDYGIFVDANDRLRVSSPAVLEDLVISDVARPKPRSSSGTAEACLWVGNTATVRRALLRDCAWAGLWTGTAARDALFEDLEIDRTPVGAYIEHFTTRSIFQRLRIGPRVNVGLVCEWADPEWDRKPACVDNVIQQSTIESCAVGVNMGAGTTRTTVRTVTFIGQRVTAVLDPSGIDNVYSDNDFSGIAEGASTMSIGSRAIAGGQPATSTVCSQ
jgi:hypothetical protein